MYRSFLNEFLIVWNGALKRGTPGTVRNQGPTTRNAQGDDSGGGSCVHRNNWFQDHFGAGACTTKTVIMITMTINNNTTTIMMMLDIWHTRSYQNIYKKQIHHFEKSQHINIYIYICMKHGHLLICPCGVGGGIGSSRRRERRGGWRGGSQGDVAKCVAVALGTSGFFRKQCGGRMKKGEK